MAAGYLLYNSLEQLLHLLGDHSGSDVPPANPCPGPENVNYYLGHPAGLPCFCVFAQICRHQPNLRIALVALSNYLSLT
jgi:hypothetical protein